MPPKQTSRDKVLEQVESLPAVWGENLPWAWRVWVSPPALVSVTSTSLKLHSSFTLMTTAALISTRSAETRIAHCVACCKGVRATEAHIDRGTRPPSPAIRELETPRQILSQAVIAKVLG
jgi:hypothetical protein